MIGLIIQGEVPYLKDRETPHVMHNSQNLPAVPLPSEMKLFTFPKM